MVFFTHPLLHISFSNYHYHKVTILRAAGEAGGEKQGLENANLAGNQSLFVLLTGCCDIRLH